MSQWEAMDDEDAVDQVPRSRTTMRIGIAVVVIIVLLGMSAGAVSIWWRWEQGKRALEFWGRDAAQRIRHAPQVELLQLSDSGDVTERKDISKLAGLLHARHALIEDASFDWTKSLPDVWIKEETWSYAVRFTMDGEHTTVAFDLSRRRIRHVEAGSEIVLTKQINDGWRKYTEGVFAAEQSRPAP